MIVPRHTASFTASTCPVKCSIATSRWFTNLVARGVNAKRTMSRSATTIPAVHTRTRTPVRSDGKCQVAPGRGR